jgi:uncharacterized protein (DUF2267 family)
MRSTTEIKPQQDEQELVFFRSLEAELPFFSTKKIIRILKIVLTSVVKNLPSSQVSEIIMKLPSTLQLVFTGSWNTNDEYKPVVHLDELVENICKTETEKEILFTNEVDALKSILIIIKNLKIIFDKKGITVFPYSLIAEYQQAVQEGAV